MEKIAYFNQPNCYRLFNGTVEAIVTTDIGPRIIRYGFPGEDNLLAELPDVTLETALGTWHAWGGHRLWAAPEAMPRSYFPDNNPIQSTVESDLSIRLTAPVEALTGLQKELQVSLDPQGTRVRILHRLTNHNLWAIDVAPWALTIMNGGGETIIPQEPFRSHDDYLLPARPVVIWYFTNMADPRWSFGQKFIRLRSDAAMEDPQKVGVANKQGWVAYHRKGTLFVKTFPYFEDAAYPDEGCNCETYTAGSFMEVETLAPLHHLEPGDTAEHVEEWHLFPNVQIGKTEDSIEAGIGSLIDGIPELEV